ncbi:MAG: DinB family protein [Chloroflexi bacterium]|nr:DinB family protein [Chloroflexota bacterium]MBP8056681.1 DinB family protein [Chloroflexota bacterium]
MESHRKQWNQQQAEFRRVLLSFDQPAKAITLFLGQHAMLHSARIAPPETWSYEDALFNGLTEAQIRHISGPEAHSIAWCIWHIARIEDVTMTMLVAGSPQMLHQANWLERMKITTCDTGNAQDKADIAALSATINIEALRDYRLAVGCRTQEIVLQLPPEMLKQKVDPVRLQQVMAEGAVVAAAHDLIDYWSRRTLAELLLMPPTRHNFVHLNEAWQIKQKGGRLK